MPGMTPGPHWQAEPAIQKISPTLPHGFQSVLKVEFERTCRLFPAGDKRAPHRYFQVPKPSPRRVLPAIAVTVPGKGSDHRLTAPESSKRPQDGLKPTNCKCRPAYPPGVAERAAICRFQCAKCDAVTPGDPGKAGQGPSACCNGGEGGTHRPNAAPR